MADAKEVKKEKSGGSPLILVIVAMVVTVLGALGGALFWLTKSGRLPVAGAAQIVPPPVKVEAPKTRLIALEPMLVNLADPGGSGYLRLVMVLRVDEAELVKGAKPKEEKPAEKGRVVINEEDVTVRDIALAVLGRETSDLLLAPEGKEKLKQELRDALAVHMKTLRVEDVLFTEFLVQR